MSDLDLPLLPSAEQIRRREFATIRRGYDPDQVRDYLAAVASQVETLEKDLRELRLTRGSEPAPAAETAEAETAEAETAEGGQPAAAETSEAETAEGGEPAAASVPAEGRESAESAAKQHDLYEELGKRVAGLIESADVEAKHLVEEAKAEAAKMLEDARTETDKIRVDSQSRAEEARQAGAEALEKAKQEAQRMLTGLAARRENLVTQLQQMQSKLLTVAQDLEVTIDEPLDIGSAEVPGPSQAGPPQSGEPKNEGESGDDKGRVVSVPPDYVVDPRYDDLWVTTDTVDLPELASIELDFEDEGTDKPE